MSLQSIPPEDLIGKRVQVKNDNSCFNGQLGIIEKHWGKENFAVLLDVKKPEGKSLSFNRAELIEL